MLDVYTLSLVHVVPVSFFLSCPSNVTSPRLQVASVTVTVPLTPVFLCPAGAGGSEETVDAV